MIIVSVVIILHTFCIIHLFISIIHSNILVLFTIMTIIYTSKENQIELLIRFDTKHLVATLRVIKDIQILSSLIFVPLAEH